MRQIFFIIIFLFIIQQCYSSYVVDVPVEIKQPNGKTISCFFSGDEVHQWLHDADGNTGIDLVLIVQDAFLNLKISGHCSAILFNSRSLSLEVKSKLLKADKEIGLW